MQLWCDERERNGPLPLMVNASFVVRKTLVVGDFLITNGDAIYVIFERKTWKDLAASLKDNRYKTQIEKMSGVEAQKFFIFEGKSYSPETEVAGIPFYKLQAAVRHLMMLGFGTWFTKDETATAEFLMDFATQYEKLFPEKFSEPTTGGNIAQATTRVQETPVQQVEKIWRQIPSIGDKIVPAVMKEFTLYEFLTESQTKSPEFIKRLSELKYISGRTMGAKAALKAASFEKPEKILGAFPGVSVKSASTILEKISLFDFVQLPVKSMRECYKTEKTKIGDVAAERIHALLHLRCS